MADKQKPEISSQEARELLIKEQREAIENCSKEVQAVLDKHGMSLQGNAVIPVNQYQIVPKQG